MITDFARATVLVEDYETALAFYVDVLGFEVIFDDELDDGTRIVHVGLPEQSPAGLWLMAAEGSDRVGDQTGGHPSFVLYTDDCRVAHDRLVDEGVEITRGPVETADDVHLHFEDPYGNEVVLVELADGDA
ncbi:hypothetical protein SAMN05216559_0056 [Halomicrobium zhouii]|uniref:VOC domain-containing protein n=1 Tax=Halomicrobium zhouii TaxID=767519 RepID=A0A1I6K1V5_9EURY|nr:glyoxalase superfamily protein [Halomicrobium zhouii]SFR85235.1 hypothetical protein SAMN05216559_0056 [Halomicrobium zhouii]